MKHPGRSGITSDRIGDAPEWKPTGSSGEGSKDCIALNLQPMKDAGGGVTTTSTSTDTTEGR